MKQLLVVTVTKGFRHDSIPVAEEVIQRLGETTGLWQTHFVRTDEEMQQKMTAENLKQYDAVVFANTTGTLPLPDPQAFLNYIHSGHGFIAMHAGSDTFHQWPAQQEGVSKYVEMLGGEFLTHHNQCTGDLIIADSHFPGISELLKDASATFDSAKVSEGQSAITPHHYHIADEMYLFKNFDPAKVHLILYMDHHPPDGSPDAGKPGLFPSTWCRMYGAGKVFYTSLGHRKRVWNDPLYQKLILGGIEWALGLKSGSSVPGNVKG